MSMVLKEVSDFSVQAFHKDKFLTVQRRILLANGRYFSFIRQILHLYVRRS